MWRTFHTYAHQNPDGRYVVRLLFKNGLSISIGESRDSVLQNYLRAESRFNIVESYRVPRIPTRIYGLPSYAYPSYEFQTTKSLIIRHRSCSFRITLYFVKVALQQEFTLCLTRRTTNGTSLNDHLLVGPKLQTNLAVIILQWRFYQYVYSADVAKCTGRFSWISQLRLSTNLRGDPRRRISLAYCYGTAFAPYFCG